MTRFQPSPRPETTPWDAPDRAEQVLPGIWRVSTPSHGGYVLSDERQAAMPEALRRDDPFYEEDVDYALVLYGFASEFRRLPVPGIALQVENARRSVRCWHPDRWTALIGEEVSIDDSHVVRRRAAYQAIIGQYESVAASGSWADWVPDGKVGCTFRRVTGVDALGFARHEGEPIHGLVDKDRYAARVMPETFESLGAVRVESTAPITKQVATLT
ncbi:DUF7007 domain-containing protein [Sphingomonas corticis]|uniref:DUF7007 domain-containing protein n=1 Tax=Sphingomonas corticis TaxID=2722791 RepID=A0ABX1CXJ0_9SPHN|nr:hypothetical protein [Sphingomonas corticis]NJR80717.1 hypothetical protein [Sphingomonas corticis]